MPTLSSNQLQREIAEGGIFAISIDTDVFDAKGRNFENAALRSLRQFKKSNVCFVLSDIVAREMKAHFQKEAEETRRALGSALRKHNIRWRREKSEKEHTDLQIDANPVMFAETEFDRFVENTGCEVLSFSAIDDSVARIFDMYFSEMPPFGGSEKRKSEFPDAFALLTLEEYAASKGKLVLCVSADKGWLDFADQTDHLVCTKKLEDALAMFNLASQHLAQAIVQNWLALESNKRIRLVEVAITDYLESLNIHIDASSEFHFDSELMDAGLASLPTEAIGEPQVIDLDDRVVTFTIEVEAKVWIDAEFGFYIVDNEDRDHVDLGYQKVTAETYTPFELTIEADRSFQKGLVFREIDVTSAPIEVDFGHVFPSQDEDWTWVVF